jgi:hypothetical protein
MDNLCQRLKPIWKTQKKNDITFRSIPLSMETFARMKKEFVDKDGFVDKGGADTYLQQCDSMHILQNKHATIHVICKHDDCPPQLLLKRILQRISTLMVMYESTKHLEFWLLPTPARRVIPQHDHERVQPKHINGGFTYPTHGEVFIFRREEFPKVMLHETIHNLSLDTYHDWASVPEVVQELYDAFRIDTTGCPYKCTTFLNPNEAIVETWAEIFHVLFLAIEYRWRWEPMLDMEKRWAIQQARKILKKQKKMGGVWAEDTHAYSYIVLRSIILWNANEFVQTSPRDMCKHMIPWIRNTVIASDFQGTVVPPSKGDGLRMTLWGDM